MTTKKFWLDKPLEQFTEEEWESLCDGCARCCLVKLQDEDTGKIYNTSVACRLLDIESCRCTDYPNRQQQVAECTRVTAANVLELDWLPETCAYRRVALGKPLPEWHHLLSGNAEAVHESGVSSRWFAVSEQYVHPDQIQDLVRDD